MLQHFPGAPQQFAETGNALTAIVLFARGSSKGTVRLTGSHPQDLLNIQKLRFQDPVGGPQDIAILREGIKRARDMGNQTLIASHVNAELFPGPNVSTDAEIEEYVKERIFGKCPFTLLLLGDALTRMVYTGHHACCTNAIGTDDGMSYWCCQSGFHHFTNCIHRSQRGFGWQFQSERCEGAESRGRQLVATDTWILRGNADISGMWSIGRHFVVFLISLNRSRKRQRMPSSQIPTYANEGGQRTFDIGWEWTFTNLIPHTIYTTLVHFLK